MSGARKVVVVVVVVATAGYVCLPAWAGLSGIRFPAGTPPYIAVAVESDATNLGDPSATVVSLQLGRFPVVVMHGAFRDRLFSGPPNARPPTGHYAALEFDAVSQRVIDSGLASSQSESLNDLCGMANCGSRATVALQSALDALHALPSGGNLPFGINTGTSRCEIQDPTSAFGSIIGTCDTTISLGKLETVVTFSQTWAGLDRKGRRYAADSPIYHHAWMMTESLAGFVTHVRSQGASPP